MISTYIPVEGLNNTRDLGGMITKDGRRIKPHRLIRSSRLSKLKDAEWISENVALAVDLRSSREIEEEPDPVIPGVEHLHLPIFELQAEGVTRDKRSERGFMTVSDPKAAMDRMASVYLRFITTEFCLSQYRRLIRLLLEPREKAVLWHCTAGKDRTGIAALMIQEILGVDRDSIMADYMITNEYLKDEVSEHLQDRARRQGSPLDEETEKAMLALLLAYEEYPAAFYKKADELYGSFDAFIRDGLGLCDAEREKFRDLYLE